MEGRYGKRYVGELDMPTDVEAAVHAFYQAVKRSGYDSGHVCVTPSLDRVEVDFYTWADEGVETVNADLLDGRWQTFVFGGDGDD